MGKFRIFETDQFLQDLSQDFEGQGKRIAKARFIIGNPVTHCPLNLVKVGFREMVPHFGQIVVRRNRLRGEYPFHSTAPEYI